MGTNPAAVNRKQLFGYAAWSEPRTRRMPAAHPHALLLNGEGYVNPEYTHPTIYKGQLEAGETIIMAEGGAKSAWHRFDTKIDMPRRLRISFIREKTIMQRSKTGFDLPRAT